MSELLVLGGGGGVTYLVNNVPLYVVYLIKIVYVWLFLSVNISNFLKQNSTIKCDCIVVAIWSPLENY